MFRKIFVPLFVLGGILAAVTPAHSASICGNRTQLVSALLRDFSEQPSFEALTAAMTPSPPRRSRQPTTRISSVLLELALIGRSPLACRWLPPSA